MSDNHHSQPQPKIKEVGFVVNENKAGAVQLASEMHSALEQQGVSVRECHDSEIDHCFGRGDRLDLIFSFGGDGTILRTARVAAPLGIPIVGINLGKVGFLTELVAEQAVASLPRFVAGDYWIEQRLMLQGELIRGSKTINTFHAFNDIVANRGSLSRVVECILNVDGAVLTTYVADGIIFATPTGSTAYCLAAGGPIVTPESRAITVIPIAPYLALVRSLVLPEQAILELQITKATDALITVDGQQDIQMQIGDTMRVQASPITALMARIQPRNYFAATLVDRLRLRG